jgi:hypothetical protein
VFNAATQIDQVSSQRHDYTWCVQTVEDCIEIGGAVKNVPMSGKRGLIRAPRDRKAMAQKKPDLNQLLVELDYAAEAKIDLTVPHKNCAHAAKVIRAANKTCLCGHSGSGNEYEGLHYCDRCGRPFAASKQAEIQRYQQWWQEHLAWIGLCNRFLNKEKLLDHDSDHRRDVS